MQIITIGDFSEYAHREKFRLRCPITGRHLYKDGQFVPEIENNHYYLPLCLLPQELYTTLIQDHAQWERWWNDFGGLDFITSNGIESSRNYQDPVPDFSTDPIKTVILPDSGDPSKRKQIPFDQFINASDEFFARYSKINLSTEFYETSKTTQLLKTAEQTLKNSATPDKLPPIGRCQLTGSIIDILASNDFYPTYHQNDEDRIYFHLLDAFNEDEEITPKLITNRLQSMMLPTEYLLYQVNLRSPTQESPKQINLHLFNLRDLEH